MFCLEPSQPWRVRELRARSDRILQLGAAGREKVWVGFFLYDSSEDLYTDCEDLYGGIRQRWLGDSGDLLAARGSTETPIGRVTTSGKECNPPKPTNAMHQRNLNTIAMQGTSMQCKGSTSFTLVPFQQRSFKVDQPFGFETSFRSWCVYVSHIMSFDRY